VQASINPLCKRGNFQQSPGTRYANELQHSMATKDIAAGSRSALVRIRTPAKYGIEDGGDKSVLVSVDPSFTLQQFANHLVRHAILGIRDDRFLDKVFCDGNLIKGASTKLFEAHSDSPARVEIEFTAQHNCKSPWVSVQFGSQPMIFRCSLVEQATGELLERCCR
jgi:hypothetical protein